MRREVREVTSASTGASGTVVAYGHWGRPVLVFPAEAGEAEEIERHGMVDAVADLLDAGRVKLYCVDAADAWSWSDRTVSLEERARRHEAYEARLLDAVVPWVVEDCGGGTVEIATAGVSLGAFHALNLALRHADRFPLALCFSGNFDPGTWHAWGERGDAAYFNSPVDYVPNLHGEHLDWLRSRLSVLLVVGQGAWEVHPTGALPGTLRMAEVLQAKGIRCELDVWGYDVPHDWPSWQRQLAHHLPRFC
jgi:esterase/lipase superfamily enzyme